MVSEAVAELKGEPVREPAEIKIDIDLDGFLPTDYVPREDLRLEAYRRLASVETHAAVDDIAAEWTDRYGPIPEPAKALLEVGHLRAECARLGIREITVARNTARISPLRLLTSQTIRLRRLVRDAVYKEDLRQLVLPVKGKGVAVATGMITLLRDLVPEEAAVAS
jgi:transcription-repair coupling factor (superfamily II helicase)